MEDLTDRVAVVTGGSSGIGLAVVQRLRAAGARVVSGDLQPAPEPADPGVLGVVTDLATAAGCDEVVDAARERYGRLDVLVNNVGIAPTREGFESVSDDDWWQVWNLNLMSAVRTTRAAVPLLRRSKHASVVMICSTTGRMPDPYWIDYAASKAALLAMTRALAEEYGPAGVRFNAVSPGSIRTPLWDRPGGFSDELARRYDTDVETAIGRYVREERRISLGRAGNPEDVANAVAFLASDAAAYLTGSDLAVHGGSIKTI